MHRLRAATTDLPTRFASLASLRGPGVVFVAAWLVVGALAPPGAAFAESSTSGVEEEGPRLAARVIDEDGQHRELSSQERRKALARAREEVRWWHEIDVPAEDEARYAYMERMLRSLRFFFKHGLNTHLQSAIEEQRVLRENDPGFCVLAGLVNGYSSTLEARNQGLEDVRRALRLDPRFAFARFADGLVRILREQARLMRGHELRAAHVRIAVANLERALEARPELAEAQRFLALGHAMLAKFDAALSAADRALELQPERTATWRVCVAILRERDPQQIVEAMERRLREHAERLPTGMRLHIYGMIADAHMRQGGHNAAFEVLVRQALPVAHEYPETLRASQWRSLYADAARAAVRKDPRDLTLAFGFLTAAKRHCRDQDLRRYPLVQPFREVLAIALRERDTDSDAASTRALRTHGGTFVTLLAEAIAQDSLSEREAARVVEAVGWLQRTSPVSLDEFETERATLWGLLRWLFVQHRRSEDAEIFELGMTFVRALLPVEAEREHRRYDEAVLEGASLVVLREVQRTLSEHGLVARQAATRQASAHILARLMRSTEGDRQATFVEHAEGILSAEGLNEAALDEMVAVCEVMRLYPVQPLARPLLAAMRRVHATENAAYCRRLFPAAHAALNSLSPERHEPDWQPNGQTPLQEYARLLEEWQSHPAVAGR